MQLGSAYLRLYYIVYSGLKWLGFLLVTSYAIVYYCATVTTGTIVSVFVPVNWRLDTVGFPV